MTIGLMILAIALSLAVLGIGLIFPSFLEAATSLTKEFDFSDLLVNVMLPFYFLQERLVSMFTNYSKID